MAKRLRDARGRFVKVRSTFITTAELRKKAAAGTFDSLRKAAAYVRGIAKRMIKRSKKASQPGSPPHTKRGALKRSILYAVEGKGVFAKAVIGPSFTTVGRVMLAHEYGGRYRRERFAARPLMTPALGRARDRLPNFWRGSIR